MQIPQFSLPDQIWAGTSHSLDLAREAHNAIMAGAFNVVRAGKSEEEEERSYLISQVGNIGVLSIKGGLTNRDSYWNRFAGMVSYNEIRKALVQAAEDESFKAILLDIDSGGGSVAGLADVSNLVKTVKTQVKPVYAFTDGAMASAAYWLGSSASEVYTSETAMMGSIGVIATHMEYSKAYKEAGIGVTVMRAGEFKALLNPHEPLTDKAKLQFMSQLADAYNVFISHVAEARGVSLEMADQRMGQGREFFGSKAVDAGLADGITSFDKLVSKIESKLLDSNSFSFNNSVTASPRNTMTRQALTQTQIAALAAGAAAAATAPVTEPAAPAAAAAPATEAATEPAPAAAAPAAAAPAAEGSLVTYLQGQVTKSNADLLSAQIELSKSNEALQSMRVSHDALLSIACASVRNMRVALGMSPVDMGAMSASQVLADHSAMEAQFKDKFKAGGVSAVAPTESTPATTQASSHLHRARIAATQYPTK